MTPSRAAHALLLALCMIFGTAAAASAQVPFETFAAKQAMGTPRISPNGKHIAVATRKGKEEKVLVYDIDAQGTTLVGHDIPKDLQIDWVDWANDDRVLIGVSKPQTERWYGTTYDTSLSRVIAANRDGTNPRVLLKNTRKMRNNPRLSGVLGHVPGDPNSVLMAANDGDGKFSVFRVNVNDGKTEIVQRGNVNTFTWLVDTKGDPRIRVDFRPRTDRVEIYARKSGTADDYEKIYDYGPRDIPTFEIAGFSEQDDTAIVVARHGNDRAALYEYNLNTRTIGKPIFQHPVVEVGEPVGGPINDPYTGNLAGIYYAEDTIKYHYIDPALAAIQRNLQATFSDSPAVGAFGWSTDRSKFVVVTRGPQDPGAYYLYDPAKNHASLIGRAHPDIPAAELGETLIIKYKARDGTKIPGYLTLPPGKGGKNLPLIVMPHGGPEVRDIVGYDPWAQGLVNRGYAVFQPNFRGSGGYGKAFAEAGHRQWGRLMQDDITDGVKALIADGTADANRICIVGASYGGYAALAGGAYTPDLYKCVVAVAGVSDIPAMLEEEEKRFGLESSVYNYWVKRLGDPKVDLVQMQSVSPALQAQNFKAPVLLIHGFDDDIVPIDQSRRMDKALKAAGKKVEFIEVSKEGHHFSKPENLLKLIAETEKFVSAHIGK